MPVVTTFADAPIMVPFPPKQAPRARTHQRTPVSATGMVLSRKAVYGLCFAGLYFLANFLEHVSEQQDTYGFAL